MILDYLLNGYRKKKGKIFFVPIRSRRRYMTNLRWLMIHNRLSRRKARALLTLFRRMSKQNRRNIRNIRNIRKLLRSRYFP